MKQDRGKQIVLHKENQKKRWQIPDKIPRWVEISWMYVYMAVYKKYNIVAMSNGCKIMIISDLFCGNSHRNCCCFRIRNYVSIYLDLYINLYLATEIFKIFLTNFIEFSIPLLTQWQKNVIYILGINY